MNHSEIVSFLWGVADLIRDTFKRGRYQDVILPLTVLRRLDCVLADSKDRVLATQARFKGKIDNMDAQLRKASGYAFYNTSRYDFDKLLGDAPHVASNLRNYIAGFSQDGSRPQYFDQNNNAWSGYAYLGRRGTIDLEVQYGNAPFIWVWEDDNGEKCDFNPEEADSVASAIVASGGIATTGVGISQIAQGASGGWYMVIAGSVLAAGAYYAFTNNDDFVGIASNPAGTDPSTEPRTVFRGELPVGILYTEFRPGPQL